MRLIRMVALISAMVALPTIALADCIYNGQTYPTGTRIGSVVCQPDGTWLPS